jgi:Pvc16 N-terminal domain
VSNPFAIAAVSETFRQLLGRVSDEPTLVGTTVTTAPLDTARGSDDTRRQLNLFLYQVTPNAALRNSDLPFRDRNGDFTASPVLALNLGYVVTAYGLADSELDAHHLLAHAMSLVNDEAVLTRRQIDDAVTAVGAPDAVAGSDLAGQVELVKLTPVPITHEELFKLWSAFQTNYRLSVGYEANVVLIERPKRLKAAPPVRRPLVSVLPIQRPSIERVSPERPTVGVAFTVRGRNLRGPVTRIRFGDTVVAPDPAAVRATHIDVPLPPILSAGVNTVQVVHELELGDPQTLHHGVESNIAPFVLRPLITTPAPLTIAAGATLTVDVEPPVGPAQRISLLVGESELPIPPRDPATAAAGSLDFPIPADFPNGGHLLRIRVDGAESPLEFDETADAYTGPRLDVT